MKVEDSQKLVFPGTQKYCETKKTDIRNFDFVFTQRSNLHFVLCVIISPLKFCFRGFSHQYHKIIIFFVCFLVFQDVI
jgi:hypothetical protein